MSLENGVEAYARPCGIVANQVAGYFMSGAAEDADTCRAPAKFDGVVQKTVVFGYFGFCLVCNARPCRQAVVAVASDVGIDDGRMAGSLRKINAVCEIVPDEGVGDGQPVCVVQWVFSVHFGVIAGPDAYFKMLNGDVVDGRAFAQSAGNAFVVGLLVETGCQI